MADNDDKRTDDNGAKKTLTLKGGPGLGNRPGMSRGPSRSTVVVEKRTRLVPKPNAPSGAPQRPQSGAANQGRPGSGRPAQQARAPLGLSAAEAEARRQVLAQAGARQAEDKERFAAEEARRMEEDARRRQIREEAAKAEQERQAEEAAAPQAEPAPAEAPKAEAPAAAPDAAASTEEAKPFTPASQRNAGPSSVRVVAGRPGQPPRPPRAERPSNARPESERGANAYIKPGAAGARPSGTATRPAGERRPTGAGMAPIGNVPPAGPNEADGRKIRSGTPQVRPTTEAEMENARRASRATPDRPTRRTGQENGRGRLTVTNAGAESDRDKGPSLAAMRRRRDKKMGRNQQEAPKISREVTIPEAITVAELANRMAERSVAVIKLLMAQGQMATINDVLDADTAELIATELGHTVKRVSEADVEEGLFDLPQDDKAEDLTDRAPVVTIMGHVDHGKTSLLDAIREANVVSGEAGGITQHIGAYQVTMAAGSKITFIDTPGHAAFTEMRSRGAKVTDIVVLVVAADDSVMPQTIEAINHAKAAGVPMIIAINKIDKPGANPSKVKTELLQHEVVVEEMGGEVQCLEVSAKQGLGLTELEEAILLQAEVLDLKANPGRVADGVVVEARMEKGRGPVATVLVQRGTLKNGDIFVTGPEWGRVRALVNDHGVRIEEAIPGMPVEVTGLNGVPSAGDDFVVVENEAKAREVSDYRQRRIRETQAAAMKKSALENMFATSGEVKELPIVIKGDVQGSVEALIGTLQKLGNEEVSVRVLHSGVGGINESDVTLARASNALIIGFNVRANQQAREQSRRDNVDIRYYSIIYDVADDIKKMLSGMLSPEVREKFLGYAEIRDVFTISGNKIAGCMVTEGTVKRGAGVRLLRDNIVIHTGDLSTLRRFKDEVKDVREGYECGMSFAKYNDLQVGDMIECFEQEEIAVEL